jgi:lipopolysaccharide export system protein LptA
VDYHEDKKFAETLGGSARLSAADGSWLSAGKIVYDIRTGVANATGGVTLENTSKNMTGSGDRAVYDAHETGYIELIGNARATQDGNTVTGDKLRITNVSGKDSRTHAQGNVRIVYYPQEKKKAAEADPATLARNTETETTAGDHKADAATTA